MSTKSKEPKAKKSHDDYKHAFGMMSKEDKNRARVQETQASVRALAGLVDSLKAMGADARYTSKTQEQVQELREEYNRLVQANRQNPDAKQMKALRDKAQKIEKEAKKYFCEGALENLNQYRGKTLPEEQYSELVRLRKTSEVEFQQKVVKSLYEQQWLAIKPRVAECCKIAERLKFGLFFQTLGRQEQAKQARAVEILTVDADTATRTYRLDFKAAVRCGNAIIAQVKILEAEFKTVVEQPTNSVREFVARPTQQNRVFKAVVASEGMLGQPKLKEADFSAIADRYKQAIDTETSTGPKQALVLAKLGIFAFGNLQAAWQEYQKEVKVWNESEGTRIKNRSSVTAILVDQQRRKNTEQLDQSVENAAAPTFKLWTASNSLPTAARSRASSMH